MIRRERASLALCVGLLFPACGAPAGQPPAVADAGELIEADRAFNSAVADGGTAAWGEWFAQDGAYMIEGVGEIRGRAAILEAAAFLDVPGVSLTWEPERADIASSGDLGWTTGRYVSVAPGPDGGEVRGEGRYVSIWRRQEDGSWKVVMDLGNSISP